MAQRIEIITDDDVKIVGNWATSPTTVGGAVLLHMFPSTKESWAPFQQVLAQRGIASLAIDLRGHGESNKAANGRPIDYQKFTEAEHVSSVNDVRAAYEWIRTRGLEPEQIAVIGASIGANLAVRFAVEEPRVPAIMLLSPGLNYHGVNTIEIADEIAQHQGVWIAASSGDDDESVKASNELMKYFEVDNKVFKKLKNAGHGTKMFEGDDALMGEAANWIRDRIQAIEPPEEAM
jgi:pimeloyl-ACP methyl ester carboxylesterase